MTENTLNPTVDRQEEEQLVRAAQVDARAFEVLYLRYVKQVYRYLYSRIGSQADAEDVTAQTFLSALEGFGRYHHEGYFGAWLFGIARRKAVDHFRQAGHSQFLPDELPALDPDLLQQAVRSERLRELQALLLELDEDEQELLRLRYAAQLSFGEIARLMERKEDALKKSLYRLLDRLHSRLEDSND
jgi:RNA polymerase sigma-70 factor, ECF subfamily